MILKVARMMVLSDIVTHATRISSRRRMLTWPEYYKPFRDYRKRTGKCPQTPSDLKQLLGNHPTPRGIIDPNGEKLLSHHWICPKPCNTPNVFYLNTKTREVKYKCSKCGDVWFKPKVILARTEHRWGFGDVEAWHGPFTIMNEKIDEDGTVCLNPIGNPHKSNWFGKVEDLRLYLPVERGSPVPFVPGIDKSGHGTKLTFNHPKTNNTFEAHIESFTKDCAWLRIPWGGWGKPDFWTTHSYEDEDGNKVERVDKTVHSHCIPVKWEFIETDPSYYFPELAKSEPKGNAVEGDKVSSQSTRSKAEQNKIVGDKELNIPAPQERKELIKQPVNGYNKARRPKRPIKKQTIKPKKVYPQTPGAVNIHKPKDQRQGTEKTASGIRRSRSLRRSSNKYRSRHRYQNYTPNAVSQTLQTPRDSPKGGNAVSGKDIHNDNNTTLPNEEQLFQRRMESDIQKYDAVGHPIKGQLDNAYKQYKKGDIDYQNIKIIWDMLLSDANACTPM